MLELAEIEKKTKEQLVILFYELQKPDNLFKELKEYILQANKLPVIMVYPDQSEAFIQGKTEDLVQYSVGVIKQACIAVGLKPHTILTAVLADLAEEEGGLNLSVT